MFLDQLIFRRAKQEDLLTIVKLLAKDELGKTRESLSEAAASCYEEAFQKIVADPNHSLMVIEYEDGIRPLSKFADASEVQGVSGAQIRSVQEVLEDASTGVTQQFVVTVEFPKKSITGTCHLTLLPSLEHFK